MTVQQKKARAELEKTVAQVKTEVEAAGITAEVAFDWNAYDAIDWNGVGKEKFDFMGYEVLNVAALSSGVQKLIQDPDYKEALSSIKRIIYRPTNDTSITMRAVVADDVLTFENYSFGSTRGAYDYEAAAKAVL